MHDKLVAGSGDALARPMAASHSLRELSDLPGPRGWPLLGNLLQIDVARLHTILGGWATEFGPLYRFRIGRASNMAIADTNLIHNILRERPEGFRRLGAARELMLELGIDGVFTAEGPEWRRQRKLTMHALNTHHLLEFFERLEQVTARLQRRWECAAERGGRVDVQRDLMRFTVDVTSGLVFGHDLNTLEEEGDIIQRHLDKIFPAVARRMLAPIPYWRWVRLPADRKLDAAMTEVLKLVNSLVAEARARVAANATEPPKAANLLDAMITAQSDDAARFTDGEIVGNTLTMLLAGEDTTANTLTWMMHLMAEHSVVQDKMKAEVDRVLGAVERPKDYASVELLRYVEATAHEAMRLKPVAPFLALETNRDTVIGDVRVRKNTGIYLLTGHAAVTQSNFADPRAFRPERWLDDRWCRCRRAQHQGLRPVWRGCTFLPWTPSRHARDQARRRNGLPQFRGRARPDSPPAEEVWGFAMMPKNAWVTLRRRWPAVRSDTGTF